MPNPANPQSLNRYSYVLNNPLRYVDPTGHDDQDPVDYPPDYADYVKYYTTHGFVLYSDWHGTGGSRLLIAYNMASRVNPDLPRNVFLMWAPMFGGAMTLGGVTPGASDLMNAILSNINIVLMDPAFQKEDVKILAMILAHEIGAHVKEGRLSNSVQEEVKGYQLAYETGLKLGVDPSNRWMQAAQPFVDYGSNPTDKQLAEAQQGPLNIGGPAGGMYQSLPLRPGSNPFGEWVAVFGMVKGLIVGAVKP